MVPRGPVAGHVTAPPSKSVTNRLLVIAGLSDGVCHLSSPLVSDDTEAMAAGLRALGIDVGLEATRAVVTGRRGAVGPPRGVVGAGLSGTTLRFLAAVSLLSSGPVTLDGLEPLRRRPIEPLLAALRRLGAEVTSDGGRPPVVIDSGGLRGGPITVDAAQSSQFASALLLVAPYAAGDVELVVENLGARGYVDLTADEMARFGVEVHAEASGGRCSWHVAAGQHYRARDERVEYDASAAAHLYALALATGGSVTVDNTCASLQPDAGMLAVLERMGAEVRVGDGGATTLELGGDGLLPVDVDLREMPDQVATVAVLAALAPGTSRLTGLGVVRGHETDRLAAVARELNRLGGDALVEEDGLVVRGGHALHGGLVSTYDDHRMAMAFSVLGAVVGGIAIDSPGCVAKTYPGWWTEMERLGVGLTGPGR